MADRVVKVKLVADVSDYTAGLVKAAAATKGLGGDIEKNVDRDMGPSMRRAGEKSGGLLARGMNQGLMRNSPLIVAGVTAALAAGAPAVLAGATVLFGAVGGLAAAQTSEVREAWTDMGHGIRDSAVQDASVLVPVYVAMADKIGSAFERMRPEIRDAFEAAAPLIGQFTNSLTQAAENAMPGLVRAVEQGGPVIEGLGSLMESIGTGLSDFLDAMSSHSGAAGEALAAIGDVLEQALPLLGELLGTGSELASLILPPLADALGVVADVAAALGPVLPAIVTGFAAMKVARLATGWVSGLSASLSGVAQNMAFASYNGTAFAGAAGKLSTASSGMATSLTRVASGASSAMYALPALGIVIAGIADTHSKASTEEDKWAQAILAGGDAAADAYDQYQSGTHWGQSIDEATGLASSWDDAQAKAQELRDAMSPLERAQLDLSTAVAEYGPTSDEARIASVALSGVQAQLASDQDKLAFATNGVSQAMLDQAAIALAAANSDLAYRMAVDGTDEAVSALTTAIQEHGATSEEAADAALQVEQALLRQADAARQSAFDTSGATSEAGKNAEADAAMLAELLQLQSTMGSSFPAALNTTIARLQGSTNAGMVAAAQFGNLGLTVEAVPNSKTIIVSSTTPEQVAQLEALGYTVRTLPDGRVEVTAATAEAEGAINYVARDRYATIHATVSTQGGSSTSTTAQRNALYGADGGVVHAFASGGFERMRGGVAQVVAPNTWRVIGDRVTDDEAYIPINDSARSHKILQQTMGRMGYGREMTGGGGGGAVTVAAPIVHVTLDGRELRHTARVEAAGVVVNALAGATNRGSHNP